MNEENFEYLSNSLRFMGFGEMLQEDLREALEEQKPKFQLTRQLKIGNDEAEAVLFFRKSENGEFYFFIKYCLSLKTALHGQLATQPFYIYKGKGITLKEGYNLLCGRAVNKDLANKEGQYYNAWLQLDLSSRAMEGYKIKQYNENYRFDLRTELSRLPIKELNDNWQKEMIAKSLEKGNLHSVNFERGGIQEKMFIEANPRFRTINIYDSDLQDVEVKSAPPGEYKESFELESTQVGEKEIEKKDGQNPDEGTKDELVAKRSKRRRIQL